MIKQNKSEIKPANKPFVNNLIIGGLAGVISRTFTAPLELMKMQQQNKYLPNTTIKDVINKEGIRGLWKGNYVNSIRIFPQNAINYSCYNYFKTKTKPYINNNSLHNFCSATFSGIVSMIAIYPLENIRSRLALQTNKDHYKGVIDIFRKTPTLQLYNGLKMSIIGFTPYNAFNFMFYNMFKESELLKEKVNNKLANQLICGGFSGVFAVSLTYPTDLIRRRLQLQGFDKNVPKYNGIIDCVEKIYKNENGLRGLYRGLTACYIKIFPAIAIQFWAIEKLKLLL